MKQTTSFGTRNSSCNAEASVPRRQFVLPVLKRHDKLASLTGGFEIDPCLVASC